MPGRALRAPALRERLRSLRSEASASLARQAAHQRPAGDAPERAQRRGELVAVVEARAAVDGGEAVLGLGVRARRPAPVPLGVVTALSHATSSQCTLKFTPRRCSVCSIA